MWFHPGCLSRDPVIPHWDSIIHTWTIQDCSSQIQWDYDDRGGSAATDFSDRVSWCLQGCSFCPLCMCGCQAACIPLSSAVPWLLILMSVTKPSAGHIKYKMLSVDLFKSIILKHHIQNHNLRWTVKSLLRKGFIVVILERGTQIILYHFYYQLLFDLHHQSVSGLHHNPFEYICLLLLFLPAEGKRFNGDLQPTWGSLWSLRKKTFANINLVCDIFDCCCFQI